MYVCRQGRDVDFVKVLDFGLVKHLTPERGEILVTGAHAAGGTPAFMSPEQVLGDRPVDGRSDIYALGCVAYWLVTGELVFAGRTAMETMMQHAHEPPVPPSQRTEIEIPDALDQAILACLAKSPDDRPATADALASRLASIEMGARWTDAQALQWWEAHHPATDTQK